MNLEQRLARGLPLGPPGGRAAAGRAGDSNLGDDLGDDTCDGAMTDGARGRVAAADAAQRAAADAAASDPMSRPPPGWGGRGKGAKAARADAQWDALQRTKAADADALRALDALRGSAGGRGGVPAAAAGDNPESGDVDSEEAGSDDDDDDDAGFLARYRRLRLAQLKSAAASAPPHGPVYGDLRELAAGHELPPAVDGVPPPAAAVVLLWEPYLPAARALRAAGAALAPAHPGTCFLALRAGLASASFDPIALPALVVYRGGAVAATLLRAHELLAADGGSGGASSLETRAASGAASLADPLAGAARGARGRMTTGTSAHLLAAAGPAAVHIDASDVETLLVREGVLTLPDR
jgi:hypothetical protein